MPHRFGRPVRSNHLLASFTDEASRLREFAPPFRFTSFFSPEDTLLCLCASEAALAHARIPGSAAYTSHDGLRIADLTTGSGLVGLHLLRIETGSTLLALDVDPVAIETARGNAEFFGVHGRARFDCIDLWSETIVEALAGYRPHLITCNPPYVPEPKAGSLQLEAGAGEDGTAHLMRAIELTTAVRPRALSLSWCSLSDPARIVRETEAAGYILNSLFVVAIADGEYSGSVHDYLRSLPNAYISESDATIRELGPDGSARFGYLLIAGEFSRERGARQRATESETAVQRLCEGFAAHGVEALINPIAPIPVRTWILDRWDELRLRASLHGEISMATTPA
ncbi:MAG: methyltransferase [Gemmatimonadaceae bacterium]